MDVCRDRAEPRLIPKHVDHLVRIARTKCLKHEAIDGDRDVVVFAQLDEMSRCDTPCSCTN